MHSPSTPDFDRLFDPDSIALVGASGDPDKLAGRPQRFLEKHGFDGTIHLVNPGRDEIGGTQCYDSVTDIPGAVDVAMVLVPAHLVTTVVEECGEKGIPFALVIASGFGEVGADGAERERALLEAAADGNVTLIGPNAQGILNLHDDVTMSFSSMLRRDELQAGNVAFVTQSGAFGGALFQLTQELGIGTSKWISTGNEIATTALDVIGYLVEDPETDVIVTYLESINRGERLSTIARRAAATDTAIVVMRVGRSAKGKEAAASHTGSIATDDDIYDAVFEQYGLTRVWSVDEFTDAVTAFSGTPPARYPAFDEASNTGLGVISVSGGAAVLIADTADRFGVPMAELDQETVAMLDDAIPPYGSPTNPVDVTGSVISDPEMFERCLSKIVEDDSVESLLLQFGNTGDETIEVCKETLFDVQERADVSIATVFTGSPPAESTARELRDEGVLVFRDPVRAVKSFEWLGDRATFRSRVESLPMQSQEGSTETDDVDHGSESLPRSSWDVAVHTLADQGITFAESEAVHSAAEAVRTADEFGYPVVLKLDPIAVPHKAELDGVKVGLRDADEVQAAYEALASINVDSDDGAVDSDAILDGKEDGPTIIVQAMAEGIETIVGVIDDPDFGPVMLFGPGGTFVELFDEFAYRSLPITEEMAREMIAETPADDLLDGFRNLPAGDRDALVDLMVAVSRVYERYDVDELELNPVIVTEDGALTVDLLID